MSGHPKPKPGGPKKEYMPGGGAWKEWTPHQSKAIGLLLDNPRYCNCPSCVQVTLSGGHLEIEAAIRDEKS